MRLLISIWFNIALLFVFTAAPISHAWACCTKSATKEISSQHKSKCQKECCKKEHSNHQKNNSSDNCGTNCTCAVPNFTLAVLEQTAFVLPTFLPHFDKKQTIPYSKVFPKSVFIKFWQPPKL